MTSLSTDSPPGPPPSVEPDTPDPGRGRNRLVLIAAVAAAVVAVIVGVLVFGGDDGDGDTATPSTSTPVPEALTEQLTPTGQDLADLLVAGRDRTVHATYKAVGGDDLTLEVWRKDGKVRQDTHLVSGDSSADTSGFLLSDGRSVTCSRRDAGAWTCVDAEGETTADGVFASVLAELAGTDVQRTEDSIDGRDVSCFGYEAADGSGEMCLDADGVPIRATVGPSSLVLESLDDDVDDSVFEPPAASTSAE